ncbi:MAG: HAD family phosphatase, partial [Atopobiaceae bacterium]|nr:HAD family phosphatase [Atopobiaceae bacterium]
LAKSPFTKSLKAPKRRRREPNALDDSERQRLLAALDSMVDSELTLAVGTLLSKGASNVSYRTVWAIRALLDAGVRFAPATGRQVFELDERFFGERACYQTAIAANGKRIYVDGELRHETLMDRGALLRFERELAAVPNAFLVVEPAVNPTGERSWPCVGARAGDAAWFEQNVGFPAEAVDALPDEEFVLAEIACVGSDDQYERVIERVRRVAPEYDFVTSQTHWCDVLPKGSNKGSALRTLLRELGISAEEVVFFGDMENDLALMEVVPNSVAVANATPAVAAAARWHVGDVADEGVTVAIEEITRAVRAGETPAFMRRTLHMHLRSRLLRKKRKTPTTMRWAGRFAQSLRPSLAQSRTEPGPQVTIGKRPSPPALPRHPLPKGHSSCCMGGMACLLVRQAPQP